MRTGRIFTAAALAFACALASAACRKTAPNAATAPASAGWDVLKDGKVVAWIDDKPGPLISRAAPPPPGTPPAANPFMRGTSKDVMSESALRALIDQSTSFSDFTARLKNHGYELRPATDGD